MNARVRPDVAPVPAGGEPAGELDSLLRAVSARKAAADSAALCVARVVSADACGSITVEFPGSGGPLSARLLTPVPGGAAAPPLQTGQQVVLAFENADPRLPIILGFLYARPVPESAPQAASALSLAEAVIEADVDGKRMRIVAQDEIVLQCGNASITLRRNGRVVIRGTYLESCSEGTNRIKGGQVRIN